MKRTTLNMAVDALGGLVMLGLVATGIILRLALPPGTNRTRSLWGLSRHEWGDVHFWLSLAVIAVVLVHVAMHWSWVVGVTRRWCGAADGGRTTRRARVIAGTTVTIVLAGLIAGFCWVAVGQVRQSAADGARERAEGTAQSPNPVDHEDLRGSTTLGDAAAAAGLSVATAKERLGVAAASSTDRLGQLGRRHGFTMADARRLLGVPSPGRSEGSRGSRQRLAGP